MTKPFEPKATLDEMSRYLTEVDGYLLSLLKDQSTRLEHIEEMAQVLISSGADPVDEFGPAETYANELADAAGRTSIPVWVRLVMVSVGGFLLTFGFFNTIDSTQIPIDDLGPQDVLFDPYYALFSLVIGVSFIVEFSPKLLRIARDFFRTGSIFARAARGLIIFGPFMFLSIWLIRATPLLRFSLPESLPVPAIAAPLALTLAGFGLLVVSGYFNFLVSRFRNRRRPNSVFRYRLSDNTTRVRLLHPSQQTVNHPHLKNLS